MGWTGQRDLRSGYPGAFKIEHGGPRGGSRVGELPLCISWIGETHPHSPPTHVHTSSLLVGLGQIPKPQRVCEGLQGSGTADLLQGTSQELRSWRVCKGDTDSDQARPLTNGVHPLSNTSAFQADKGTVADKPSHSVHSPHLMSGQKTMD